MDLQIFSTVQPLILASASPRRQDFLTNLGIEFKVITADIDETPSPGEKPESFAVRMAKDKARKVASKNQTSWIIGADTVVALLDDTILGKPENQNEAIQMLSQLNNATHMVVTGMCLCCREKQVEISEVVTTEVTFSNSPESLLKAYVRSGEPLDKAGSYGIQGLGSFLVESIHGSCANVIGLPVNRLVSILLTNNIISIRS